MTPANMTPERWQKVEEVFETAIELPAEEREAFLTQVCGEDDDLRTEIASLLENEAEETFFQSAVKDGAQTFAHAAVEEIIGQRIGAYRITGLVGQGGMGAVYRAVRDDDQFNQQVAIKIIKRGMDTGLVLRRFWRERQILASLNHQNIARLLDGGTTPDGRPYFAMEFIEGQPISDYCEARELSIPDRLKLFRQVCAAVQFAHQNLIVHRDIKPANILVTEDGTPKLLDFGIAKLLASDTGQASTRTVTGMRLMTPDYASPEQVRGGTITTASDIYSLGTVLYELLTGQHAHQFKTYSPVEIEETVCLTEAEKPSEAAARAEGGHSRWRKQLAGDVDNIVLMALRKEPERRYQSVEQFSEDIRRHLEGLPVIARKDTVGYRTGKFARRNKLGIAAVALVMLSLIAGLIATLHQTRIARAESARAEGERARAEANLVEARAQKTEAESQRAEALRQRSEADVQRALAEEQRAEAQAQTVEAMRQRALAEAERAKAENRFGQVRKLANTFLFDFHDKIRDLPGSTPARELVVKTALEYLDGLARESAGDTALQWELATAYEKVADVQGNPNQANLGQTAAALESYRKTTEIAEKLLARDPANEKFLRMLASVYSKVGPIELRGGKTALARQTAQKGIGIAERLLAVRPADDEVFALIIVGYANIGATDQLTGDIPGAMQTARQRLAIANRWMAERPGPRARASLATSQGEIADISNHMGDLPAALELFRQALAFYLVAVEEQPNNAQVRRQLVAIYGRLASVLGDPRGINLGDTAAAIEHQRKALAIAEELAAADPKNVRARNELNFQYRDLGLLLGETNPAEAIKLFDQAFTVMKATAPAGRPVSREYEAMYHAEVAQPWLKMGNRAAARQHADQAGELLRAIPIQNRMFTTEIADKLHLAIGDVLLETGDVAGALENYRQALSFAEGDVAASPFDMEKRYGLAFCHEKLGKYHVTLAAQAGLAAGQQTEHWREARAHHQKATQVWNEWSRWGKSSAFDVKRKEQTARALAECDAALAKLGAR